MSFIFRDKLNIGAIVDKYLKKCSGLLARNKSNSDNNACIVLSYLSRFYFFKLSVAISAGYKDIEAFDKLLIAGLGSNYLGWTYKASLYAKNFKVIGIYLKKIKNNACFFTKSTKSYNGYLKYSSIDLEELRREGIKDLHSYSVAAGYGQDRSLKILCDLTSLSKRHLNDIINDTIQPTGEKSKSLQDFLNKRMYEIFEMASNEGDKESLLVRMKELESLEIPCGFKMMLGHKQYFIDKLNELLADK